jgi:hypothetical protein
MEGIIPLKAILEFSHHLLAHFLQSYRVSVTIDPLQRDPQLALGVLQLVGVCVHVARRMPQ